MTTGTGTATATSTRESTSADAAAADTAVASAHAAAAGVERADLLQSLRAHRFFLQKTTRGLTDAQARLRSTPSALTVGGLINHVAATEKAWARFIVEGAAAMAGSGDAGFENAQVEWAADFELRPDQTLADALARYEAVAARTDELVASLPDLDAGHLLPEAPWFEPGATWSARRALLHIIAETAQHAGHSDIIREAIDGAKTMG